MTEPQYAVHYTINRKGYVGGLSRVSCPFEEIRIAIAIRRGVNPEEVQVKSIAVIEETGK